MNSRRAYNLTFVTFTNIYRILLISWGVLLYAGCASVHPTATSSSLPPPGSVHVEDNFFADKTEVSNIGYWEYQHWLKRVFGPNSAEYRASVLDTTVWLTVEGSEALAGTYHRDLQFAAYPVVGVTIEQAKSWTEWRGDRVVERTLAQAGGIQARPHAICRKLFYCRALRKQSIRLSTCQSRQAGRDSRARYLHLQNSDCGRVE